jgi:hypothetical protein
MRGYYRRDGTPYDDHLDWARDFEDMSKRVVKQEKLPNGRFVSTVWLGLNHAFGDGPPLIFETMVFGLNGNDNDEEYCERYSTETEALAGHEKAVKMFSRTEAVK